MNYSKLAKLYLFSKYLFSNRKINLKQKEIWWLGLISSRIFLKNDYSLSCQY